MEMKKDKVLAGFEEALQELKMYRRKAGIVFL